jgi:ADP-ribosylglycohydrolase
MLVEIAIGDTYASAFEYASDIFIYANNNLSQYYMHHKRQRAKNLYTDDTQMSIAIAELILENEWDTKWEPLTIANKFVECFKRHPITGYSKNFYNFLNTIENGEEFLSKIKPTSDKNGAAMRSCPIGFYNEIDHVLQIAEIQARLTHNTDEGIHASKAVALASHLMLYDKVHKEDLGITINCYVPGKWEKDWKGKVLTKGSNAVLAALTVLKYSDTFSEILSKSVEFSGDVDTVAAISMGLACYCGYIEDDLQDFFYDELYDGIYGRSYLLALDDKLLMFANEKCGYDVLT